MTKHHETKPHHAAPADAPATATPPAAAAPETAATPAAPSPLQAQVDELQKQLADATDKYLRTRADFDNYRKRVQRDIQDIRAQEKSGVIQGFLGVLDHFQMAREHAEKSTDPAIIKQGLDMIHSEFRQVLSGLGIELVQAEGQPFDPRLHEAVSEEASATVPAGGVIRQWKAGYRLGETLLRPAVVVVSSGPQPAPAAAGVPESKQS